MKIVKKKGVELLTMLGMVLFVSAFECEKIVEPPAGWSAGVVTDSLSGLPIDSAWVDLDSLPPFDTYTDSAGHYVRFMGTPDINKYLYSGKTGYKTKRSAPFEVFSDETTLVNFELNPSP
jgi:hypothetical protein